MSLKDILFPPTPVIEHVPNVQQLLSLFRPEVLSSEISEPTTTRILVDHLTQRTETKFFISQKEIIEAVAHIDDQREGWRRNRLARAATEVSGKFSVYGTTAQIRKTKDWNSIAAGPGKDILYPERPHRFDFAASLALAALYDFDSITGLTTLLSSWIEASDGTKNATGYISSHLCVYRIISLSWAIAFLGANEADIEETVILATRIIIADARVIMERLPHTTPNNHLCADSFALWYAGMLFPELDEASRWRSTGKMVWLREFERQIYADGCSFEHSIHYQEHVLESAVGYVLLSQRNDLAVEDWVLLRLRNMLDLQMSLVGPEAAPLALGDTTEDPLFPLDCGQSWGCGAWADISRHLFQRNSPVRNVHDDTRERGFWLLGGYLPGSPAVNSVPQFSAFPEGGYFVFAESDASTRLIFRTGPGRNQTLRSGHMHADLLSIYLVIGGRKMLAETGTYTYRSRREHWPSRSPQWRRIFYGPESSNGLVIAGHDPLGRSEGDFPVAPNGGIDAAVVDLNYRDGEGIAYTSAITSSTSKYDGHRRTMVHIQGKYWVVIDHFPTAIGESAAYLNWQLDQNIDAELVNSNSVRIHDDVTTVELRSISDLGIQSTPRLEIRSGFVSPTYGMLSAAPAVVQPITSARFNVTWLCPNSEQGDSLSMTVDAVGTDSVAVICSCDGAVDWVLLASPKGYRIVFENLMLDGALAWIQIRAGEIHEIRCVDLRRFRDADSGLTIDSEQLPFTGKLIINEESLSDPGSGSGPRIYINQ